MRKVTMLAFALLMMVSFSFAANVTFKVNMMAPIDREYSIRHRIMLTLQVHLMDGTEPVII